MIDYQLLTALAAIVSEGGFEKAANKLFITQSAVSRRVQTLETLLGEPVLIRSKPPKPTVKGVQLLNHLQQVMQLELSLGIEQINEGNKERPPLTIRLAANADSLATWLPEALARLTKQSQRAIKFDLVIADQSIILNRMKSGEVMACISSDEKAVNGGEVSYLGALSYKAVASPCYIEKYQIKSVKDLVDKPCLASDEDDLLQHQFLKETVKSEPTFIHACPCPEGFKQAIIAGLGYGLVPEIQCGDDIASGKLVVLDKSYVLDVPLYWHYWHTEGPQLKALRKHAQQIAAERLIQL